MYVPQVLTKILRIWMTDHAETFLLLFWGYFLSSYIMLFWTYTYIHYRSSVLYRSILYYALPQYITPCCTTLNCTILCNIILYCYLLYYSCLICSYLIMLYFTLFHRFLTFSLSILPSSRLCLLLLGLLRNWSKRRVNTQCEQKEKDPWNLSKVGVGFSGGRTACWWQKSHSMKEKHLAIHFKLSPAVKLWIVLDAE